VIVVGVAAPVHGGEETPYHTAGYGKSETSLSLVESSAVKGSWPKFELHHGYFRLKPIPFGRAPEHQTQKTSGIPHAVGVTEILGHLPREGWWLSTTWLLIEFASSPTSPRQDHFQTKQAELVIGYRPDLVFTVFYSDPALSKNWLSRHPDL
jgi:iron complex transport system substrate-binding protein